MRQRIKLLLQALGKGLYEKEEALRLGLLCAVAGESLFLLGKPGVAKSMVARRLKYAFARGKAFEYLMSRFSTPDEIFGPVSVSKLKDQDRYERVVRNYLPDADVVFLDEIWKAGPSIQNALLTALNEKLFRNGGQELRLPLKALIAASNELPAENEGLEALWDRFLVRCIVEPIRERDNFEAMLLESSSGLEDPVEDPDLKIRDEEYARWSADIDRVLLPPSVMGVLHALRASIERYNEERAKEQKPPVYVSDRRWRKIVRLLRASAFLNGRTEADLMDCTLIAYCIWDGPELREPLTQLLLQAVERFGWQQEAGIGDLKKLLEAFNKEVENRIFVLRDVPTDVPVLIKGKYYRFYINNHLHLIDEADYRQLNQQARRLTLTIPGDHWRGDHFVQKSVRASDKEHYLIVADYGEQEHKLETETKTLAKRIAIRPAPDAERRLDERAGQLQTLAAELSEALQRQLDDGTLRDHLFGLPELVPLLEAGLQRALKETQQLAIDLRQAVHRYKRLPNA